MKHDVEDTGSAAVTDRKSLFARRLVLDAARVSGARWPICHRVETGQEGDGPNPTRPIYNTPPVPQSSLWYPRLKTSRFRRHTALFGR